MSRWYRLAWLLLLAAASGATAQQRPALLILGTTHFGNPGRDVVNTRVPDVMSPARQAEIEAVVARLASFRPTHVAVEWPSSEQARLDQRYADYRAGRFQLTSNERDQIGLRLAARLGLPRVDAVDWNENAPGPESDYDYSAWAQAHGRGPAFQTWVNHFQAEADAMARLMACTPISAWIRAVNVPAFRLANHRTYFFVGQMGELNGANPGAAWVGSWYARNLRILNNLRALASRPGARVVAIYGAGHGYLLDQLARESGEFAVADPLAFLPRSPRDSWTRCPG